MNKLLIASLALLVLMTNGASIPKEEKENHRQGKTLGLLTVGTQALGSTVGTAGKVLGTAVGVISAIKPLLLLGLGKYWLYNHLNKDNNGVGAGVNLQAGNGFGVNANVGYNHQYISQGTSSFTDSSGTTWYETPSNYKKTESVSWQTSSDADKRKRK